MWNQLILMEVSPSIRNSTLDKIQTPTAMLKEVESGVRNTASKVEKVSERGEIQRAWSRQIYVLVCSLGSCHPNPLHFPLLID